MQTPSAFQSLWFGSALASVVFLSPAARAHKVSAVSVVTEIDTAERTCKVELAMDVEPTGDPAIDDLVTPEQAAHTFATEALKVYFDDVAIDAGKPEIRTIDESDESTPEDLRRKKVVATVLREIPEKAENFLMYVDETTEAAVVMVVIKNGQPARRLQVLYPGEFSNPVNVEPVIEADPFPKEDPGESEPAPAPAKEAGKAKVSGTPVSAAPPAGMPRMVLIVIGVLAIVVIAGVLIVVSRKR